MGILQSVREIPGFLALLAIYFMLIIKEHKLSALSVLIMGIGICLTGIFPTFTGLIFTTLLMSFGFHYYETTNQSLTLQYFDTATAPWVFGRLRSLGAITNVIVGLAIFFIADLFSYKQIFLGIGGLVALAGLWAFTRNPTREDLEPQHRKMVFRKKYWLFYVLKLMAGARRQIFMAFAVFLLVSKFGLTLRHITALFVVNNVINYFLAPTMARLIVRYGERHMLTAEYLALIFIFVGYAVTRSRYVAAGLYIVDHIFFNFSIAINTYFQKVADKKDIAPSMAMSFTINHIAAVIVPAIGGLMWIADYRIPFFFGAFLSLISIIFVRMIDVPLTEGANT